jgi:hypothetical protein
MQLSDSDDEDKPDRPPIGHGRTLSGTAKGGAGGKKKAGAGAAGPAVTVVFKRERPVVRERPVSARAFRTIAVSDPEIKVSRDLLVISFYPELI